MVRNFFIIREVKGMKITFSEGVMTAFVEGEIDHHTAGSIRTRADNEIIKASPDELILDFSDVTFMDSSGVGLVIGRYKLALSNNCRTVVTGLNNRDKKILMLSGLQNKVEFR